MKKINDLNIFLTFRIKKTSVEESEKSCMDVCDGAKQEIKRQKLDGGHSRKVLFNILEKKFNFYCFSVVKKSNY